MDKIKETTYIYTCVIPTDVMLTAKTDPSLNFTSFSINVQLPLYN